MREKRSSCLYPESFPAWPRGYGIQSGAVTEDFSSAENSWASGCLTVHHRCLRSFFGHVYAQTGTPEVKASDVVNPVNTAWTLIAAFLVFGMQVGFTMLEAGFAAPVKP